MSRSRLSQAPLVNNAGQRVVDGHKNGLAASVLRASGEVPEPKLGQANTAGSYLAKPLSKHI